MLGSAPRPSAPTSEPASDPNRTPPDRPRPGRSVRPTPRADPARPRGAHTMQVTVSIHEAWFARPEDLRRVLALLAGLEIPPPGTGTASRPVAVAEPHDPRGPGGAVRPGTARPGPVGTGPGRRLGAPGRRRRSGRADQRQAVVGLGLQASPRPEGDPPQLRQAERPAVQDRRLDAGPSLSRLPVRPRHPAID